MSDSKGINPVRFAGEVRQEAKKVTWTTGRETIITSIMVFIMVALAALFLRLVDWIIGMGVNFTLLQLPQMSETVRYSVFGGGLLVIGAAVIVLVLRKS